jgi:hypothetical protein
MLYCCSERIINSNLCRNKSHQPLLKEMQEAAEGSSVGRRQRTNSVVSGIGCQASIDSSGELPARLKEIKHYGATTSSRFFDSATNGHAFVGRITKSGD